MFQLLGRAAGAAGAVLKDRQEAADASALLDQQLTARTKRENNIRKLDAATSIATRNEKREWEAIKEEKERKRKETEKYKDNLAIARINLSDETYSIVKSLKPEELNSSLDMFNTGNYYGSFQQMIEQGIIETPGQDPRLDLSDTWKSLSGVYGGTLFEKEQKILARIEVTTDPAQLVTLNKRLAEVTKERKKEDANNMSANSNKNSSFTAIRAAQNQVFGTLSRTVKSQLGPQYLNDNRDIDPSKFRFALQEIYTDTSITNFDNVGRDMLRRQKIMGRALHSMTEGEQYLSTQQNDQRYVVAYQKTVHDESATTGNNIRRSLETINRVYAGALAKIDADKGKSEDLLTDKYKESYAARIQQVKNIFTDMRVSPVILNIPKSWRSQSESMIKQNGVIELVKLHNQAIRNGTKGFLTLDMDFKLINGIFKDNPFIDTFKLTEPTPGFKEIIWGDRDAVVTQGDDGTISWDVPDAPMSEEEINSRLVE